MQFLPLSGPGRGVERFDEKPLATAAAKMHAMLQASLAALPRRTKRLILAVMDAALVGVAAWAAFALRLADPWPEMLADRWWLLVAMPLVAVPVFALTRMYDAVVRYMSPRFVLDVAGGVAITALAMPVMVLLAQQAGGFSRSVAIIYGVVAVTLIAGARLGATAWMRSGLAPEAVTAIIYGAGEAGAKLATMLATSERYRVVALVDDDPTTQKTIIGGRPVLRPDALPAIVARYRCTEAFLALDPAAPREHLRSVVQKLLELGLSVRRIPAVSDLVEGRVHVEDVRPIAIEELLGRDVVPPREALLDRDVRGRCVLVSGAGGSIGSELARQIVERQPSRLVLFEQSEYALYEIAAEIRPRAERAGVELQTVLGSVRNADLSERVLRKAKVDTVYHAAAYKHVPMVELNVAEGVANNALGTLAFAEAAIRAEVGRFTLVSTDKAVRPTSVMGASKRLAELVLQALQRRGSATRFCMVRFGNVLGSSGSVVPLFRKQIAAGGPVTVTHPEVIRYFMTIPEAAELVLQAGAMGEGGEVFVLDMGEPVKIADLARLMIRLAGRRERTESSPEGDVELVFTGLRPGEKLHEELLIGDNAEGTEHPMIMRAREREMAWADLEAHLRAVSRACRMGEVDEVRALLAEVVEGYSPQLEGRRTGARSERASA